MSEIFIREELDLIKKSGLLNQIGCSVGPKKNQIFMNGML